MENKDFPHGKFVLLPRFEGSQQKEVSMQSIGIDLGNTSVKVVVLSEKKEIEYKKCITHYGSPISVLEEILSEIEKEFSKEKIAYGAFTGIDVAVLHENYKKVSDVPAIDKGLKMLCPDIKSAIEIGSQNARYLTGLSGTGAPAFAVNEGCAGGTGSFFEDQMYRLGLDIEEYSKLIEQAESVPRLSGRCSVFAKTDIIHRQQEGVGTPDILLGLCYATIKNFKATIVKNMPVEKPLALCGGVTKNQGVIRAVKEIFELTDGELFVSEDTNYIQAIGAAAIAFENRYTISINELEETLKSQNNKKILAEGLLRLQRLSLLEGTILSDPICRKVIDKTHCSLGIDVGSTSTNLVLIDKMGQIVDFQYLRTKGNPKEAVKEGLANIQKKYGDRIAIDAVGVTGSGRYLIGQMVGADIIKDEITAQARAAVYADPKVDTVFEIGGQDSKYISMKNGEAVDFQMNKICAAGTGSFIEEQAGRLHVPLTEYGKIALSAKQPVDLGERCTVFIESNISDCLSKGVETADILAGLCHSVIHNYLFKVVGNKPIGEHIVLQGGVCYNPAVVAAFQAVYGKRITVSPYFSVSGAYGVSLLAAQEIGDKNTQFKGFTVSEEEDSKENISKNHEHIAQNMNFYDQSKKLFFGDYTREKDSKKETIGVPYVLVVHKLFPMIRTYFEALGFNVLLSSETNEGTIALSQKHAQAETCYPVKLIYGHMAELADKRVDYIFLPSILTMKHECSHVYHNYGCVYMQTAPKLVFDSMKLNEKGIRLLNPSFSLDFGQQAMAAAMVEVGISLGKSKLRCGKALLEGAMAVRKHTAQVEKLGEELLAGLKPDEKVLVLITRTYGIEDPVLNMEIPKELLKRGYKVITLSHLPAHSMDISGEYENLYWPFGQHIISGAKLIRNHPNLYAVYLTNHGCVPDTMLSHLFRTEMGDKPYLSMEVDEHFSKVGVITRIEAFLNSLDSRKPVSANGRDYFINLPKQKVFIQKTAEKDKILYLPYLPPYSMIVADRLCKKGYQAKVLPVTDKKTLALGKSKTVSKEYLSFAALAGDVLRQAQTAENAQFLIPQTEGSEADGMYARVIHDMIEDKEKKQIRIVAPTMETLPFSSAFAEELFLCLLAGDIVLFANKSNRESVLKSILDVKELSVEFLQELVKGIYAKTREKAIMLVGEPYILFHPFLNYGLFEKMEEDRNVLYMPFSEYMYYLWSYRYETKIEKKKLIKFKAWMEKISEAMGENSPFARECDHLFEVGNQILPKFAGANGRYRIARTLLKGQYKAYIEIASMYENTQTILELAGVKREIKTFTLSFEGSNEAALKERLDSFLFYMDSH
ncbi:acyl-CoA dehydratase activase [Lacrimispora sp. 38-1]|uniref:acyl-CoA dehydratase activase n=1 Tax=Lacrimispora sp. 38-1 TaxID=3125778 RepID=UPI003CE88471